MEIAPYIVSSRCLCALVEEFLYALLVLAYNGVEIVAGLFECKGSFTTSTLGFNVFSLTWVPAVDLNHIAGNISEVLKSKPVQALAL